MEPLSGDILLRRGGLEQQRLLGQPAEDPEQLAAHYALDLGQCRIHRGGYDQAAIPFDRDADRPSAPAAGHGELQTLQGEHLSHAVSRVCRARASWRTWSAIAWSLSK